ncbi:MAG: 30S ribosomal protein S4e [Thermoplasmata archaeon]|nr:MAG: 30S ribosomal protein S4e [Thermoplasmata archaeon]RLF36777.1 MAG: 30S ribosomal protein S4e [Thermoplasmata archaeon]
MSGKHLKRLAAPRTLRIHRKEKTWTTKISPGPHPLDKSIPLGSIVRDYLKLCDTYKEAKRVIANGDVLVDGVERKNHKFPCGFMDVLSIPKLKKDFRILFDRRGKLTLVPISSKDAKWKLCRIENKTVLKGNKIQLNLHDGRNKIVEKDEYKTGDVLKISLADRKISEVFPFTKGTVSMIIGGSHIGQIGTIEDVEIVYSSKPNIVTIKGDQKFSTIKDYVFPIGKTSPVIIPPEVKIQ